MSIPESKDNRLCSPAPNKQWDKGTVCTLGTPRPQKACLGVKMTRLTWSQVSPSKVAPKISMSDTLPLLLSPLHR